MNRADDILDTISTRKSAGVLFALATVVRTVAATAVDEIAILILAEIVAVRRRKDPRGEAPAA
jgi:hypothetical protein